MNCFLFVWMCVCLFGFFMLFLLSLVGYRVYLWFLCFVDVRKLFNAYIDSAYLVYFRYMLIVYPLRLSFPLRRGFCSIYFLYAFFFSLCALFLYKCDWYTFTLESITLYAFDVKLICMLIFFDLYLILSH